MSKSVLPVSSSESFIVSSLTLKFLIHFELIFVYGVKEYVNFILLHCCSVFLAPLIEETVFFLLYILASFTLD